jgi:hypothetical protein
MARRRQPTLSELMRARSQGDYASTTPGAQQALDMSGKAVTDRERQMIMAELAREEQLRQLQAQASTQGAPEQPRGGQAGAYSYPGQQIVGQPSGYQVEVGPPVEQVSVPGLESPYARLPRVAPDMVGAPATQDELIQGLALKARDSNPASKTYLPLPAEVVNQYGIEGVDLAALSIGEKLMLRKMGVQFPGQKARTRAAQHRAGAPAAGGKSLRESATQTGDATPWAQFAVQPAVGAFGVPDETRFDGNKVWMHRADVPPPILAELPKDAAGMDINLDKLSPEQRKYLENEFSKYYLQRHPQQ